jgi:hypothetical protein
MKQKKCLGIWLDHSHAHLIDYNRLSTETDINSDFTHQVKEETLHRSEQIMHNKEQHEQREYFITIANKILEYDEVVLFGPTNAKLQLFTLLRDDHRFANIRIETRPGEKMTHFEEHEFVRNFFSRHLFEV